MMTKEMAVRRGKALLKKMKGKGWRMHVHENLGWHYRVGRRFPLGFSVKVYQYDDQRGRPIHEYWCLYGDGGGLACWSTHTNAKDPNESVRKQFEAVRNYANRMARYAGDLG